MWRIIFIMVIALLITGCSQIDGASITNIMTADKTVVDYSFIDYAIACTDYIGVNLSTPEDYCNDTFRPVITNYNAPNNYTQTCCQFNTKCQNYIYPNTSIGVNEICSNNVSGYQPISVVNTTFGIKVLCCDGNGANCYVDTTMNVYDPNSACKLNYTQLPVSSFFNNSQWSATCCANGVSS